ncbi:hypothetical protein C8R44DRAFT_822126 [Mycena epipterygia]|nr:hypothetical protein C8R44DRAFT_822126 [Mycena epipterygia]
MFILGTTGFVLRITLVVLSTRLVQQVIQHPTNDTSEFERTCKLLLVTEYVIFAMNYVVTDSLFLYRCYVIWGSQKKVVILPGVLILSTLVIGCVDGVSVSLAPVGDLDVRIPYVMGLAINLVLLGLTAGRIWWMRRATVHAGLDDAFRTRYNTAVTIILESGAIYCICLIVVVITLSFEHDVPVIFLGITVGLSKQVLNIAPTLTIVRVGLGHNIHDTVTKTTENPAN